MPVVERPENRISVSDDEKEGAPDATAGEGARDLKVIEVLRLAEGYLARHEIESPRLDAEHLLAGIMGCTRLDLYLRFDERLDGDTLSLFRENLKRRALHFPLQYIVGEVEFFSLPFCIREGVFIPRPETELLVEWIEEMLPSGSSVRFLEFGAGAGVISGTLAVRRPSWSGAAFDISPEASSLARENIINLGVADRVSIYVADDFNCLDSRTSFDLLVANPPYIPTRLIPALREEISRHEDHVALDGGDDGIRYYTVLAGAGARILRPGGVLAVEIGDGQAGGVRELLRSYGYEGIEMRKDYNGMERLMAGFRPGAGGERPDG